MLKTVVDLLCRQARLNETVLEYQVIEYRDGVYRTQSSDLELSIDYRLPYLKGDETRLKQILINLVKNAIKFTKEGRIMIEAAYNVEKSLL